MYCSRNKPASARPAFTLMELMVSVAILLAILALIGTIFATTSKAGGNATALTTVARQLRQAAEIIRQDLERMDPASDMLGIAGVQIQARNNRKLATSIDWQRADVLMVITDRRDARPYIFDVGMLNPDDYFGQKMQVVYGHADRPTYQIETAPPLQNLAYEWHLARRSVFFPNNVIPLDPGVSNMLTHPLVLGGEADVFQVPLEEFLNVLGIGSIGGYFEYNGVNLVRGYATDGSGALRSDNGVELYYDGSYWYRQPSGWVRYEEGQPPLSLPLQSFFFDFGSVTGGNALPRLWFYPPAATDRRTIVDPDPRVDPSAPLASSRVVANSFLPNCSYFRVEYTYDDPREVGTPVLNADVYGGDPLDPDSEKTETWVHPIRWEQAVPGQQLVWSRLAVDPNVDDRTDPHRWPRALRITLKAWDPAGRLDEPVTYTLIHTWPTGN